MWAPTMAITPLTRRNSIAGAEAACQQVACKTTGLLAALFLRRGLQGVTVAALAGVTCSAPRAETWHIVPSFSYESTFTNNVALTSTDQRSDWVNQFTPAVSFTERGAHSRLAGRVALPVLLYARTSGSNDVVPEADVAGTFE